LTERSAIDPAGRFGYMWEVVRQLVKVITYPNFPFPAFVYNLGDESATSRTSQNTVREHAADKPRRSNSEQRRGVFFRKVKP